MKIYFFDFDGTISNRDSFILFSFFSLKLYKSIYYWFLVVLQYGFVPNVKLKEQFFNRFKSIPFNEFQKICDDFECKILNKIIKKSFINYVKEIDKDSKVIIVSASINNYLKPWCDKLGFDLISTELEVIDGKLTGKFSTPNCNREEKVRRIKEKYNLYKYDEIHVFGNSKGDVPMLELGTHKYYKFFK